jgi:hypothetical protein
VSVIVKRDLRKYARQTNLRMGIGLIILLLIVGIGLIDILIGSSAAFMGLICLSAGLIPLLLIGLSLWLIDEFIKRTGDRLYAG